jgi:pyruvate dehydrogenase E2 component (dihydrolipoamide acetyltransferase)
MEVKVPDIGDFDEVPVIEVLVEAGQEVSEEEPLITLESDKATMDVPAPAAGVVGDLKVSVGDKVSEGTLILTLEPSGGNGAGPDADAEEEPEAKDEPEPEAKDEPSDSYTGDAPERAGSGEQPEAGSGSGPSDSYTGDAPERAASGEVYASPSVRRKARERGIDLSALKGSGRGGRVTLEDLDKPAEAAPSAPAAAPQVQAGDEDERVDLTRIQRISGPRLQQAWQTIPHVTQFDEADITDLEAFRKTVNAEQDVKVTMVALVMKACIASLKAHPAVNASLDGDQLILRRSYHLGFAADTPNGLLVPVIRDVDRKGLLQIAGELRELSGRAREGKLKGEEMRGATFTISSLGGIGGTAFTPIINPPEVAILGVSKSAMKPVWDGAQFVPRLMVPLSLSYDHRVIDGALAARFTAHLAGVLSDFRRVLL